MILPLNPEPLDGSKYIPKLPESLDIKISNKCPYNCQYCHENSLPNGKLADLDDCDNKSLLEELKLVPLECPFGGGSLSHSENFPRLLEDIGSSLGLINFTLNAQGAKIFGDFTGTNVGKRLAIVLDNRVYSAPSIK